MKKYQKSVLIKSVKVFVRFSFLISCVTLFFLFFHTPVCLFSLSPSSLASRLDIQKDAEEDIRQTEGDFPSKEKSSVSVFQKLNPLKLIKRLWGLLKILWGFIKKMWKIAIRQNTSIFVKKFEEGENIRSEGHGDIVLTKEGTVIKKVKKSLDQKNLYEIAQMEHSGICPIKNYEIEGEYLYYERPFYQKNLAEVLKEKGPEEKKSMLFQIFCTLNAFYERNIDIVDRKLENIVLDSQGNIVFIDFEDSLYKNLIYYTPEVRIHEFFNHFNIPIPQSVNGVVHFWIQEFYQFKNLNQRSEKSFTVLRMMMADILKNPFFDSVRDRAENSKYILELEHPEDFMTVEQKETWSQDIKNRFPTEQKLRKMIDFENDPEYQNFQRKLSKNMTVDLETKFSKKPKTSFAVESDTQSLYRTEMSIFDENTAIHRYVFKDPNEGKNVSKFMRFIQDKNPSGFLSIKNFERSQNDSRFFYVETPVPFFIDPDLIDRQTPRDQKAILFQILAEISFLAQNGLFRTDYKDLFNLSEVNKSYSHIFRNSENNILFNYIPKKIFDEEEAFDFRNFDILIDFIKTVCPLISISQKLLDELRYKFYDICLSEHCDKEVEIGFLFTDIMKASFFDSVRDGSYEQELLFQLKSPEKFLPDPLKNETKKNKNTDDSLRSDQKTQIHVEEGMRLEYFHIMEQIQKWNHPSLAQIRSLKKEEGDSNIEKLFPFLESFSLEKETVSLSYEMPIYQKLSWETLDLEEKKLLFAEILLTISYLYERGVSPFPLSLKENIRVDENKRVVFLPSTKWHYLIERDDVLSLRSFLLEFSNSFSSQEDRVKLEKLFDQTVFRDYRKRTAESELEILKHNRTIFADLLKNSFFDSVRDRVEYWKNLNVLKKKDLFMTEQQLQKSA